MPAPATAPLSSLTGRYHDAKYHFPTDFTGVPVDRNQFTTDETAAFALDVGHRFSEIVEGQLLLGRSDIETGFENPADPPPGPGFASSDRTSTDRTSADGRVQLTLPKGIRGLAGASFEAQRQDVTGAFREGRDNWGIYAQATVLPVSRLQLTAGGRLDENEKFGSFWTYRAAALAFASPTTRIRGSVGTGFKEPGFFENFDSPFSLGNPDLRPERSFSVEGGVEQDFAQRSAGRGGHGLRPAVPRSHPVHLRPARARRAELLQCRRGQRQRGGGGQAGTATQVGARRRRRRDLRQRNRPVDLGTAIARSSRCGGRPCRPRAVPGVIAQVGWAAPRSLRRLGEKSGPAAPHG